jgi:hypothetical protein
MRLRSTETAQLCGCEKYLTEHKDSSIISTLICRRCWSSRRRRSPSFFFDEFPLFAVFHAVRRCLNAAMLCDVILDFPDAMELIVGADSASAPGCRPGDPPGYLLRTFAVRQADSPIYLVVDPKSYGRLGTARWFQP